MINTLRYLLYLHFWDIEDGVKPVTSLLKKDGEYTDQEVAMCESTWTKLKDEFFERINSSSARKALSRNHEILAAAETVRVITNAYQMIMFVCNSRLPTADHDDMIIRLYKVIETARPGFKIEAEKLEAFNLKRIDRLIRSLTNEYNIKFGEKSNHSINRKKNRMSDIANLSKAVGMRINPYDLTCEEYFAYQETVKDGSAG